MTAELDKKPTKFNLEDADEAIKWMKAILESTGDAEDKKSADQLGAVKNENEVKVLFFEIISFLSP